MLATALRRFRRVAVDAKAESDQLDQGGLAGAARADDNVQAGLRPNVKAIEESFLNLNPLNNHLTLIDQARSRVDAPSDVSTCGWPVRSLT